MSEKTAWAIALGLILGSLLMGGCCSTCSPWGATAPAGYSGGYGPAATGGLMTTAPPAGGQTLSTNPGWRASGTAQPASVTPATP